MRGARRAFWPAQAAALIAVALLTFASAQSIVMQAIGDTSLSPWPICSAATGRAASHGPADRADHGVCSVCAAAASAPMVAEGPRLPSPTAVVWSPRRPAPQRGPHGPPPVRPKARGPPDPPLTV